MTPWQTLPQQQGSTWDQAQYTNEGYDNAATGMNVGQSQYNIQVDDTAYTLQQGTHQTQDETVGPYPCRPNSIYGRCPFGKRVWVLNDFCYECAVSAPK